MRRPQGNAIAIAITEENLRGVIRSEAGPDFDLDASLKWLALHEEGWFVRDEGSPFDCQFFDAEIFEDIYSFTSVDSHSLFRRIKSQLD